MIDQLTNPWAYILRATGIIGIEVRFISSQVNPSKGNFEHMTSFFMYNFPVTSQNVNLSQMTKFYMHIDLNPINLEKWESYNSWK